MRVCVRGTVYESVHDAANKLGVKMSTVYSAVALGKQETLGLGRGTHKNHKSVKSQPVRLGPYSFSSQREAAKRFGFSRKTLVRAKSDPETMQYVISKIMHQLKTEGRV